MNKLQALKFVDLLELIERQKMLAVKFNEKNKNNSSLRPRNRVNTLIALNTDLGEVMQDTKKYWNYWKVNCKFDKEHTLEEISDYLHFLLQFIYSEDKLYDIVVDKNSEFNTQFNKELEQLESIVKKDKNLNIFQLQILIQRMGLVVLLHILRLLEKYQHCHKLLHQLK